MEELTRQTVECIECGAEFHPCLTPDSLPEGALVDGEPYCRTCFEKLDSELSEAE